MGVRELAIETQIMIYLNLQSGIKAGLKVNGRRTEPRGGVLETGCCSLVNVTLDSCSTNLP